MGKIVRLSPLALEFFKKSMKDILAKDAAKASAEVANQQAKYTSSPQPTPAGPGDSGKSQNMGSSKSTASAATKASTNDATPRRKYNSRCEDSLSRLQKRMRNEARFKRMTRMTVAQFKELVEHIRPFHRQAPNASVTLEVAVELTLVLLAGARTFSDIGEFSDMADSTAHEWFHKITDILADEACPGSLYKKWVTEQDDTPAEASKRALDAVPHGVLFKDVRGCVDGSHIDVMVQKKLSRTMRGKDGSPTMNLVIIIDMEGTFRFMGAGCEGRVHDNTAWIKHREKFPADLFDAGGYLLGDLGYNGLDDGLLTPYPDVVYHILDANGNTLHYDPTNHREAFNILHAQLRNAVERAIGRWKRRWAILRSGALEHNWSTISKMVYSVALLDNFIYKHSATPSIRPSPYEGTDPDDCSNADDAEDLHAPLPAQLRAVEDPSEKVRRPIALAAQIFMAERKKLGSKQRGGRRK